MFYNYLKDKLNNEEIFNISQSFFENLEEMKNNSLDINKKIIVLKDYINKNEDLCIPSFLLES